jgi:hypothetical protein
MLDLLLGRPPPARPATPTPAQLPSIAVPRPSLRRLVSGRGIDAQLTANEPGPVLVEVDGKVHGQHLPLAATHATFSEPETRTVKLVAPSLIRHILRRETGVRAQVVVSQCTSAGYEYTARSRIILRRR